MYKARHTPTGHIVGLKIINLDTEDDDVVDIQKEISLLSQLMLSSGSGATGGSGPGGKGGPGGEVPNVVKYYGSLMQGANVWIVMEYAEGGSIRTLVSAREGVSRICG